MPAQNAAWTRGQSGSGTTKGRASLAMRTRWTSSRCLVWGATTVDCNCGRRERTTFEYVTRKVTMTRRVGRMHSRQLGQEEGRSLIMLSASLVVVLLQPLWEML